MREMADQRNGLSARNNCHSVNSIPEQAVEITNIDKHVTVDAEILPRINKEGAVLLEWKSVSSYVQSIAAKKMNPFVKFVQQLWYKEPHKCDGKQKQSEETKQVLHSVSGYAQAGDITALMGPSGSGKTTLLSILGYRAPKAMTHTGMVTYNGIPVNKTIRRLVGYVLQDDLLYPNLTVYETLYYAAMLKLPRTMSKAKKLGRVEAVILALGLDKCRNTLIGSEERRGVSGGERKRVSIGHELLTNPSVLILDEPTSGLDSTIAMRLVSSLSALADGGRVVLMTIHQPSSRLFQQLSRLVLLSEGRTMYNGQSKDAAGWFEQNGFALPAEIPIADFILDLANGSVEDNGMDGESARLYLIDCMDKQPTESHDGSTKNNMEETTEVEDYEARMESSRKWLLKAGSKSEVWGSTFFEQIWLLLSRSTKNRRYDSFSFVSLFRVAGLTLFVCIFWWQTGSKNTLLAASDIASLIFFIFARAQFDLLMTSVASVPTMIKHLTKERASAMYRLSAFYISESISSLPLDFLLVLIHYLATFWCAHLRQSLSAFFGLLCVLILSGICAQTIGMFIGLAAKKAESGLAFGNVAMFGFFLVAGHFAKDIPSWISWMQYLSITYWSYRLASQIQFQNTSYLDCGGISEDQLSIDQCSPAGDLGEEIYLPFDVDGTKWPSIAALFGILLIFKVITYYVLSARTLT